MTTTNSNGHQPEGRTAGFEETLQMESGGQRYQVFDPIEELSKGSIEPEVWMPRSSYDDREIAIRNLRTRARHRCRYGYTNTEMTDWHNDHMKMGRNNGRMKHLVEMVIGRRENRREELRQDRFSMMAGGQDSARPGSIR